MFSLFSNSVSGFIHYSTMLLMKNQDVFFWANSIYNILKIIVIIEWWKAKGHRPGLGRRPKKYQEDHSHLSPETDPHPSWMTGRYSLAESCMTAAKQTPFLWWQPWHEVEFLRHKTMIKLNRKLKPIMWPCWHVVKKKKKNTALHTLIALAPHHSQCYLLW